MVWMYILVSYLSVGVLSAIVIGKLYGFLRKGSVFKVIILWPLAILFILIRSAVDKKLENIKKEAENEQDKDRMG